jgi:glycosyltransferase involved in cell wall biosynthesis
VSVPKPLVTVVVPAHDAARTLPDCLRALASQRLSRDQYAVVVVDDGSADGSAEVAETLGAEVLRQRRQGPGAARNAGWRAAGGRWVAFTDADCIPARSWLPTLLAAAERGADGARPALGAAGWTLGYCSTTPAARFVDLSGGLDAERHLAHPSFPFAPTGNVLYRRDALAAVAGFDVRYRSYEACDLHGRLVRADGGRFVFEPRAVVMHRHQVRWRDYWRQQVWYGKGLGQFVWHHRDAVDWSLHDELRACSQLARLGLDVCKPGSGDDALIRRGRFVKELAQRVGFVASYWNPRERARW